MMTPPRWSECPRTYCQTYKACANEANCSSNQGVTYREAVPSEKVAQPITDHQGKPMTYWGGKANEVPPIAPPALGTPRTDALTASWERQYNGLNECYAELKYFARTLERELAEANTRLEHLHSSYDVQADELSAATARLNAPVPEVETKIAGIRKLLADPVRDSCSYTSDEAIDDLADLARDLGRRLAEALKRADHAYPYPEAEDWTVEELAAAYTRSKRIDEPAYQRLVKAADDAKEAAESALAETVAKEATLEYRLERMRESITNSARQSIAERAEALDTEQQRILNIIMPEEYPQAEHSLRAMLAAAIRGSSEGGGK